MRQMTTLGLALGLAVAFAGSAAAQVKMGVVGPITGPNAAFGAQLKNGTDQAVADIDYVVNSKDTLALKYYYQHDPTSAPYAYSESPGFPQNLDAGIADVRAVQRQFDQVGQRLPQCRQALIRHRGVVEAQTLQCRQFHDGVDTRVGDTRARQFELLKRGEPGEVLQSFVGDSRVAELQPLQAGELFQMRQSGVPNIGGTQVQTLQARCGDCRKCSESVVRDVG